MRRCKITIELDREDPTYFMNEPVTGQVIVDVRRATRCDELELSCLIKTHGRGDNYKRTTAEINLFSGDWEPGEYVYPFRIPIDSEQASYHGEYINVDWYLEAEVDIPKALDVSKEIDFLRVHESEPLFVGDEYDMAQDLLEQKNSSSKTGLIIFAFLVPILFLIPLFGSKYLPEMFQPIADILATHEVTLNSISGHLDKIFPLVFAGIFGFIVFQGLRALGQKKSQKMLGHPKIEIENGDEVQAGERLNCLLAFNPRQNANVRSCSAKLRGYEHAVDTSGTTNSTFQHNIFEEVIDLPIYGGINAGVPVEEAFELEIPVGAPKSFDLGKNDLIWAIEIEMQLGKWLKWEGRRLIKVIPQTYSS